VIEVSAAQLQLWVAAFLWPLSRITAFLVAAPVLGHSSIPNQAKIGLGVLLTLVVAPTLPPLPQVPIVSWAGLGVMIEQLLIGLAMGLVMRLAFTAVQVAGDIIGLQMGLGFATFFSPDSGGNTLILARYFNMIAMLMFLAFNGHLLVIEILAGTFQSLPIGLVSFNPDAWNMLARYGATIFSAGLLLALPLVASLLIINLTMGILNRSAPQLTVFSVGFPLSLTVGLVLLMVLMTDLARYLEKLFSETLQFLQSLLLSMAAG
jgi:flagellar biosynthesis protein FliR